MPYLPDDVFENNFSNEQNTTSNEDLLREMRSQTKLLDEINASVDKLLSSNQGNRYQFEDNIRRAYDSNGRNNTTRQRQGAQSYRTSSSSFGSSVDKDADDIKKSLEKIKKSLGDASDSFEESIKKGLFGASIGDIMNIHLKKLADSLGASIEDLPKMFSAQLGKSVVNYIQNSNSVASQYFKETLSNFNKAKVKMSESMSDMIGNMARRLFTDADIDMGSFQDVCDELEKQEQEKNKQHTTTSSRNGGAFGGLLSSLNGGLAGSSDKYKKQTDFYIEQASITIAGLAASEKPNMPGNGTQQISGPTTKEFSPPAVTGEESTEVANYMAPNMSKNLLNGLFGDLTGGLSDMMGSLGGVFGDAMGAITSGGAAAAGALGGLAVSALAFIGPLVLLVPIINGVISDFKELGSAIKDWWEIQKKTRNRYSEETQSEISNETQRLMDDVETIVREPFEILEDAANKVYEVWDNELRIINGTQGYTKSDLQDLMSNYSARLQAEGLTSVVSSADITEELAKVLQAGLSGAAAEEFAYIATVLNAAIPTQDFFDYVDTYVSIAGSMIAQGYSQADALAYANEQLEIFASNTLYASRELAGGFTTGLSNASDIFAQSIQIAQTAGSNNAAEISSVLTAVAAVTGSIAPDLATTMTDLIYQAATGGNSSELVALRSLAGTGASNTDFLNALVNNPQSVFVQMFTNLDKMINTSNDNYMEVAESLSEIFGISMDALRRIDFNYLADAISNMNVSDASLSENLALLASGETTTSAEQLRMEQINQYMLEEGLAYVVDNEAARFIQQHMWEEQIANDLMQAQYGVEFVGESKAALQSIISRLGNLLSLNGSVGGWFRQRKNKAQATAEEEAEIEDLEAILEAGKVGSGNAQDLYNLTTRGMNLNLTDDLVTLLTGRSSAYSQTTTQGNVGNWRQFFNTGSKYSNADIVSSASDASAVSGYRSISSMYTWSTNVGKSTANAAGMLSSGSPTGSVIQGTPVSSSDATASRVASKVEQMLDEDYMKGIIEEGGGYEDWVASARKFGITDLDSTLTDLGYSLSEVEDYFTSVQTEVAEEANYNFYRREEEFWDNVEMWLEEIYTFMDESIYQDALMDNIYQNALIDSIYQDALTDNIFQNALMDNIYNDALIAKLYETSMKKDGMYKELKAFYDGWYDYIYQHNAYNDSYDYSNVASIQSKEKTGSQDAVYALAEELTKNTTDLREPTMQTNALLAEILIVVNAIMQNENANTSATSLTDTLSGLALGLFNTSTA